MSHASNVISRPVDLLGDVKAIVPVTLQRTVSGTMQTITSNDLGTMCRVRLGDTVPSIDGLGNWTVIGRNEINKWAKYKPLNYAAHEETGKVSGSNWWRGGNGQCGLVIDTFNSLGSPTTTGSFFKKLLDGELAWDWDNPVSHYRLLDFDGYNHDAVQPMDTITYSTVALNSNGEILIQWDDTEDAASDSLTLSDIKINDGNSLRPITDYYFGVLIYDSVGGSYDYVADHKISDGGLGGLFASMGSWAGKTVAVVPFLSSVALTQMSQGGTVPSGALFASFHLPSASLSINSHAGAVAVSFDSVMWNSSNNAVDYEITLTDTSGSPHTEDIYIALLEGTQDVAHATHASQSIPAGGLTLTGSLSHTKQSGERYLLSIISLGTTTIPRQVTEIEDYTPPTP